MFHQSLLFVMRYSYRNICHSLSMHYAISELVPKFSFIRIHIYKKLYIHIYRIYKSAQIGIIFIGEVVMIL